MRRLLDRAFRRAYRELARPGADLALFYAWAGAANLENVSAKIGTPSELVQEHHLEPVRRWTEGRKRRAGLPA